MPKQLVSKEEIVNAAFEMTRAQGFEKINARGVAAKAGYSVQPIYSYFENMKDLREAVYRRAMEYYESFIYGRVNKNFEPLESMGMANIAFAKEEKHLFRLLFLAKLSGIRTFSDIYEWMGDKDAAQDAAGRLGISIEQAKELYILMIVFTHGVATMLATDSADIPDEEIGELMGKAYRAFSDFQKNNKA